MMAEIDSDFDRKTSPIASSLPNSINKTKSSLNKSLQLLSSELLSSSQTLSQQASLSSSSPSMRTFRTFSKHCARRKQANPRRKQQGRIQSFIIILVQL